MGVKFFRREDHKTGISPYFPLCYFPDREHPDYCIYRFFRNESTVYKTECWSLVNFFRDDKEAMYRIEILCRQTKEEEEVLVQLLKSKRKKPPKHPNNSKKDKNPNVSASDEEEDLETQ